MNSKTVSPYAFFYLGGLLIAAAVFGLLTFFTPLHPGWSYLLAINIAVFVLFGYDKGIAASDSLRVPERVIFAAALMGGSPGVLLGMNIFRHKTRKVSFQFRLGVVLAAQAILIGSAIRIFG